MAEDGHSNGNVRASYSTIIQTTTVVSIFVAGFWGAVILPVKEEMYDLRKEKLALSEHAEFKYRIDRDIGDVKSSLDKLQQTLVPRGEHLEHWASVNQQFVELNRALEALRSQLGNTYTLGDEIHRLQHELDSLRGENSGVRHAGST